MHFSWGDHATVQAATRLFVSVTSASVLRSVLLPVLRLTLLRSFTYLASSCFSRPTPRRRTPAARPDRATAAGFPHIRDVRTRGANGNASSTSSSISVSASCGASARDDLERLVLGVEHHELAFVSRQQQRRCAAASGHVNVCRHLWHSRGTPPSSSMSSAGRPCASATPVIRHDTFVESLRRSSRPAGSATRGIEATCAVPESVAPRRATSKASNAPAAPSRRFLPPGPCCLRAAPPADSVPLTAPVNRCSDRPALPADQKR